MKIKSLLIENFGPFDSMAVEFPNNKISVITGANASGKTQMAGAILFCLLGKRVAVAVDGVSTTAKVEMKIATSDKQKSVWCEYSGSTKQYAHSEKDTFIPELHESLSFDCAPTIYIGEDFDFTKITSHKTLRDILVTDELRSLKDFSFFDRLFAGNLSTLSGSHTLLVRVFDEFIRRRSSKRNVPLIVDSPFNKLGRDGAYILWNLLVEISKFDQVIVLTGEIPEAITAAQGAVYRYELERKEKNSPTPIFYQSEVSRRNLLQLNNLVKSPVKKSGSGFTLGKIFNQDECMEVEFKEIKGENPVNSIKDIADQYIVAFLNSANQNSGSIFWGIRDADRVVTGVALDYAKRDDLRRTLINKLCDIQPAIPLTSYRVLFHRVSDEGQDVDDLYVLEINVTAISRTQFLYSTGKGEVYLKTDGGKKKLTTYELQIELLNRIGVAPPRVVAQSRSH
jgi:hypothetical protein